MRLNKITLSIAVLLAAASFAGCGPKKPDDFPSVAKTTVKVTKDGTGVADLSIFFTQQDSMAKYAVTGITDANGVAVLKTGGNTFSTEGAPAGTYTVSFMAPEKLPSERPDAEVAQLIGPERQEYMDKIAAEREEVQANNPVPMSLRSANSSALELTIPETGGELSVELSDYAE